MNRREAIVGAACFLLLKPFAAIAAWFKGDEHKPLVDEAMVNPKISEYQGGLDALEAKMKRKGSDSAFHLIIEWVLEYHRDEYCTDSSRTHWQRGQAFVVEVFREYMTEDANHWVEVQAAWDVRVLRMLYLADPTRCFDAIHAELDAALLRAQSIAHRNFTRLMRRRDFNAINWSEIELPDSTLEEVALFERNRTTTGEGATVMEFKT